MRESKRLITTILFGLLALLLIIVVPTFIGLGSYKLITSDEEIETTNPTNPIPPIGDATLGEMVEYITTHEEYNDEYITEVLLSTEESSNAYNALEHPIDLTLDVDMINHNITLDNSYIESSSFADKEFENVWNNTLVAKYNIDITNSILVISDVDNVDWKKVNITADNCIVVINDSINFNETLEVYEYLDTSNFTNSMLVIEDIENTSPSLFELDIYRGMSINESTYLDMK